MKPFPAIIDTNILVSGFISGNHLSPPSVIVDGMLQAAFPFLLSVELLQEYRQVLLRPKIQRLHNLAEIEIDIILEELVANAILRESVETSSKAPDKNDQHLWELLAAMPDALLITGDHLLITNPPDFARVITAQSFLILLKLGEQ